MIFRDVYCWNWWSRNISIRFRPVLGSHPYPVMVRDFQSVLGKETREQSLVCWGGIPDLLVAFAGGGSSAMGLFSEFLEDQNVRHIAVEPAGYGTGDRTTTQYGVIDNIHGAKSYVLPEHEYDTSLVFGGMDHPGIGPELCYLMDIGRVQVLSTTHSEALRAKSMMQTRYNLAPSLETAHALAVLEKVCPDLPGVAKVVIPFNCELKEMADDWIYDEMVMPYENDLLGLKV